MADTSMRFSASLEITTPYAARACSGVTLPSITSARTFFDIALERIAETAAARHHVTIKIALAHA